jgi:glutamate-ammonia-ligase adenylyltransferase
MLAKASLLSAADAGALENASALQHALTQILRIAVDGTFQPQGATPGLKSLLARAGGAEEFDRLEARLSDLQANVRALFLKLLA